jgi:hypothetical protein
MTIQLVDNQTYTWMDTWMDNMAGRLVEEHIDLQRLAGFAQEFQYAFQDLGVHEHDDTNDRIAYHMLILGQTLI